MIRTIPSPEAVQMARRIVMVAGFFVIAGFVEILTSLSDLTDPGFWQVWDIVFRGAGHFLLAEGLRQRLAICRSIAMVYCLAATITYLAVVVMAVSGAPVDFPRSLRLQSLFHVPSCPILFAFLRRPESQALFPKALFASRTPPPNRAC